MKITVYLVKNPRTNSTKMYLKNFGLSFIAINENSAIQIVMLIAGMSNVPFANQIRYNVDEEYIIVPAKLNVSLKYLLKSM